MMSDYNDVDNASAPHVAPLSKEYKDLILQQLVKEFDEETARAKSPYSIIMQIIKECQKDFHWIN